MSPNIDLSTGSVTLRAVAKNPNGELISGQYVKAIVPYKTVPKALLIPESAIGTNQGGRYIYVVGKDSTILFRQVKVGLLTPQGLREIKQGIGTKDKYIVNALVNLYPGMKIQPVFK